jgi:hypothetical protein
VPLRTLPEDAMRSTMSSLFQTPRCFASTMTVIASGCVSWHGAGAGVCLAPNPPRHLQTPGSAHRLLLIEVEVMVDVVVGLVVLRFWAGEELEELEPGLDP